MFRERIPQGSLLEDEWLVPPAKAKRLEKSWADAFQTRALPLIDEKRFADMYHAELGRPNRAVQTVLGVLILKEMFDLTDEDALDQLEFNLQWHHALRLTAEESHLPQKTLHNFRVRLMSYDGGRIAFEETTEKILQAVGVSVKKQRLDSTHIMSNIARLARLGLFCETIRLFLRALPEEHPELAHLTPQGLSGRYIKKNGEPTSYEDARSL
ncbi:MAG TPA: transposase [Candidatus Krumholzibacteria bacterium]|nr:transposase [Candidatus Krumholzibacteria bacterium]